MEIIYILIVGIVLCVLGILMKVGWLNFLIDRYEGFQKAIRRKKFIVDREGVSRFYTGLFFVLGALILIVAIIGFVAPDSYELISIWIYVAIIALGITGLLYLNLSNRFLKPHETS